MDIPKRVAEIMAAWNAGKVNFAEVQTQLLDMVHDDTVDRVMDALPPEWRANMVEHFREYRNVTADTELITLFGGIMAWEHEPDPVARKRMQREEQDRREREMKHFREVTVPAMQRWLAKHDA
jgi:hypothetical protein